jgi:hypothetical protein
MFGEELREGARTRRSHRRFQRRGADVRAELPLAIGDAIRGGTRGFTLAADVVCSACGGVGTIGERVCPRCGGVGHTRQNRTIELKIPERARDGLTLRLAGLGEPGENGAEAGDLYVAIPLESDGAYKRLGADVEALVPVSLAEWLDGGTVEVATLDGVAKVKIPPRFPFATRLRLRGHGLAREDGARGDFSVVPIVTPPEGVDGAPLEALRRAAAAGPQQGAARARARAMSDSILVRGERHLRDRGGRAVVSRRRRFLEEGRLDLLGIRGGRQASVRPRRARARPPRAAAPLALADGARARGAGAAGPRGRRAAEVVRYRPDALGTSLAGASTPRPGRRRGPRVRSRALRSRARARLESPDRFDPGSSPMSDLRWFASRVSCRRRRARAAVRATARSRRPERGVRRDRIRSTGSARKAQSGRPSSPIR